MSTTTTTTNHPPTTNHLYTPSQILLNNHNSFNHISSSNFNEYELADLLEDIKIKSKELLESETVLKENNSKIEENKKKIQALELKLLDLEKESNETDKSELKYLVDVNTKLNIYDSQVNDIKHKYTKHFGDFNKQMSKDAFSYPVISIGSDNSGIRKEINKLKFEIDGLKFDNSKLNVRTNSLELRINELQCDIGNSLRKTDRMQRTIREGDKNYHELKQVLDELRANKLLFRNNNNYLNNYMSPSLYTSKNYMPTTNSYLGPYGTDKPFSGNPSIGAMSYNTFTPSYSLYGTDNNNNNNNNKTNFQNRGNFYSSQYINSYSNMYSKPNLESNRASSTFNLNQNNPNATSSTTALNSIESNSTNNQNPQTPNHNQIFSSLRININENNDQNSKVNGFEETKQNSHSRHQSPEKDFHNRNSIKTENKPQTTSSPKPKDNNFEESHSFFVASKGILKSDLGLNTQLDDTEKEILKTEISKLKDECMKAQDENRELKKKIFAVEKTAIDKRKHAELWQTMYNRILSYLPEKEAELVKMSTELEKINVMTNESTLDDSYDFDSKDILSNVKEIRKIDQENVKKQRETLKAMISRLNEENTHLRIQLEHLKDSNATEIQKLNEYSNENAHLKRELQNLKKVQVNEATKTITEIQMKGELENLQMKLEFEINEKEQLKKKFEAELHAAKIRYDNEIQRQNQLMQAKYDSFVQEINSLNKIIKELKDERNNLLTSSIEKDKITFTTTHINNNNRKN